VLVIVFYFDGCDSSVIHNPLEDVAMLWYDKFPVHAFDVFFVLYFGMFFTLLTHGL